MFVDIDYMNEHFLTYEGGLWSSSVPIGESSEEELYHDLQDQYVVPFFFFTFPMSNLSFFLMEIKASFTNVFLGFLR